MQESPSHLDDSATLIRGDQETPFKNSTALQVTAEERAGIMAFIRALKPGLYVKCSTCERMKFTGNVHVNKGQFFCDGCA